MSSLMRLLCSVPACNSRFQYVWVIVTMTSLRLHHGSSPAPALSSPQSFVLIFQIHVDASDDGCAYLFRVSGVRLITKGAVQWSGIPASPREDWRSDGRICSNRDTFRRECRIVFDG